MDKIKSIFSSMGIYGGVLAFIASVAPFFGLDVGAGDVDSLKSYVNEIVAAIGGVLAIWGRWRATAQVTLTGS